MSKTDMVEIGTRLARRYYKGPFDTMDQGYRVAFGQGQEPEDTEIIIESIGDQLISFNFLPKLKAIKRNKIKTKDVVDLFDIFEVFIRKKYPTYKIRLYNDDVPDKFEMSFVTRVKGYEGGDPYTKDQIKASIDRELERTIIFQEQVILVSVLESVPEYIMENGLKLNLIDVFNSQGKSILLHFIDFSEAMKTVKEWYGWDNIENAYKTVEKDGFTALYIHKMNQNDFTHI